MNWEDFRQFVGKKIISKDSYTRYEIQNLDSKHMILYMPSTILPRTEFIYFEHTNRDLDKLYRELSQGKEVEDFGVEYDMDSVYPIEFIRDLEELDKMAEEYLNKLNE